VHRIYCEEGLNLRHKRPRRRVSAAHRVARPEISNIDQCWWMDFVADNLFNGRRIRALTVIDNFSRESLAIHVDQSIKGQDVVNAWNTYASFGSVVRNAFKLTTEANLFPKLWINGLTKMG
jgi:putative transposase